eukprot:TRINITY_DN8195_c0_g1_i2.p1 TRINITY_DN8195_c0_g1~~TRINITY_DN8195_c0_g1_i2.p1  ORF type:complete len:297 (+),score=84.26 TRINITY_DN8195_c0_g1_i2:77-892(+)
MGGTRHSKSCQTRPYMTYDERNCRVGAYHGRGVIKTPLDVGSGTITERLGADSQRDFDCCWLCSGRAQTPVVTPAGLLYCKECVLGNMAAQKAEYKRKREEYDAQKAKRARLDTEAAAVRSAIDEEASRAGEDRLLPVSGEEVRREAEGKAAKLAAAVAADGKREQVLSSFWVAQHTPEWAEADMEEPDATVRCPFTKKPLRLKQLWAGNPFPSSGSVGSALDGAAGGVGSAGAGGHGVGPVHVPTQQRYLPQRQRHSGAPKRHRCVEEGV